MSAKNDLLVVNDFHRETIDYLDEHYNTHHLWKHDADGKAALIETLQGRCRAAATASWDCDPVVYQLESLAMISAFGVGVDGIDFIKTTAQSIRVSNTPDVLNDAVADLAMAMILMTTRNLVTADRFVRDFKWLDGPFPFGRGLAGKTLGIIGLGRIGEEIAQRARQFKLNIAYHNRNPRDCDYKYIDTLHGLAEESDILLCMLPGGSATRQLIDSNVFRLLGPEGIFINIGRGTSVNETDLAEALQSGWIAGAGLDVYENEPHVPENLLQQQNTVLFPHIGSATVETRISMGKLVIENLDAFFSDKKLISGV